MPALDVARRTDLPRRHACSDGMRRDVFPDDAPCTHDGAFPHLDAGEDRRRRSDHRCAPNRRALRARVGRRVGVVEQHGARKDPDELLDRRQLRDEDAAVEAGVVTDRQIALEIAVGADTDAVADPRPLANRHLMAAFEGVADLGSVVHHAVATNERAASDPTRSDHAERTDCGAIADDGSRAYDASLVNTGGHGAIIGRTAVSGVTLRPLTHARDKRGALAALELTDVPFEPKRIFTVYDVPSASTRGSHAHRTCHQFLVCLAGTLACAVDNGTHEDEIDLDTPAVGLHIPPMIWATQWRYTRDAVLLVVASDAYDPSDYIRDYDEFLALVAR